MSVRDIEYLFTRHKAHPRWAVTRVYHGASRKLHRVIRYALSRHDTPGGACLDTPDKESRDRRF